MKFDVKIDDQIRIQVESEITAGISVRERRQMAADRIKLQNKLDRMSQPELKRLALIIEQKELHEELDRSSGIVRFLVILTGLAFAGSIIANVVTGNPVGFIVFGVMCFFTLLFRVILVDDDKKKLRHNAMELLVLNSDLGLDFE